MRLSPDSVTSVVSSFNADHKTGYLLEVEVISRPSVRVLHPANVYDPAL